MLTSSFVCSVMKPEMFFHKEYENRLLYLPGDVLNTSQSTYQSQGGDRFIPLRRNNNWEERFGLNLDADENAASQKASHEDTEYGKDRKAYDYLLKNELLSTEYDSFITNCERRQVLCPVKDKNLFEYSSLEPALPSPIKLTHLSQRSELLLRSSHRATRKISSTPFKVLDAPGLRDDFYLNLVDWSSQNIIAVGLGASFYLYSACTSQVSRLFDSLSGNNSITSVAWNERGNLVGVGTHDGFVQVWDVTVNKQVNKLLDHTGRVGALAWNGDMLTSGSRDKSILQRDVRTPAIYPTRCLVGHRREVCGLKWSPDNQYLASGGNDNRLYVWNLHSLSPVQSYTEHTAAVKAIAWSPHQHKILASGGGTADRCIRFWNTLSGQAMQCVDTGSQVCNLSWSKHTPELVSTHGYSQNQILVWKYPSLTQVAKLTGHSDRVLYLAMAPDGEAIVTGAGDETLRFWNVFSKTRIQKENKSVLKLYSNIR